MGGDVVFVDMKRYNASYSRVPVLVDHMTSNTSQIDRAFYAIEGGLNTTADAALDAGNDTIRAHNLSTGDSVEELDVWNAGSFSGSN